MKSPLISILVPVYKVELYLERCIKSVIDQSYSNWEMILVDDGSPDKCPIICDDYANSDSRISVVHKTNGGLISARKAGFEKATGDWLMFLDSDDWLYNNNALNLLIHNIKNDIDMIKGGAVYADGNGKTWEEDSYKFEEGIIDNNKDYIRKLYLQEVSPYLWGAIYRKSLFKKNIFDYGINAGISFGEDWITNLLAGINLKKAKYIKDKVYCYYRNPHSMTHSFVISQSYKNKIDSLVIKSGLINLYDLKKLSIIRQSDFIITNLFVPEIEVKYEDYLKAKRLFNNDLLNSKQKFLLKYNRLYWYYTKFYKFIFWIIKLKGKKRKILT